MKQLTFNTLRAFAEERLEFLLRNRTVSTEMWTCATFLLLSEDVSEAQEDETGSPALEVISKRRGRSKVAEVEPPATG